MVGGHEDTNVEEGKRVQGFRNYESSASIYTLVMT